MEFSIKPVGILKKEESTYTEIFKEYLPATDGLNEGQRILLFLYFDRTAGEKRKILKVHSRGEPGRPLRGVFAARAPVRPNPIALYNVKIEKIEGAKIFINSIDAYDSTPVVDIKPAVKHLDCPDN